MTTLAKVGNFILRSGTGTQSITGVGFQPKLVIFWSMNYTSSIDPIPADAGSNPGKQLLRFFGAASATASTPIENLLKYSEQIDNAIWSKNNCTVVTNAIAGPTGTTTAEKIIPDTSSNPHYLAQATSFVGGGTFSFYAKAGELSYISMAVNDAGSAWIHFDLIGSGAYYLGTGWVAASITPVGNGWYRCSGTHSAGATWQYAYITIRSVQDTNGNVRTVTAGDGTSGLYLWGVQLNSGSQLLDYTPTTSAAQPLSNTTSNISRWCEFSGVNYQVNGAENDLQTDKCILWKNPFDGTQYMDADFTSVDPDGFTINVTTAAPSGLATTYINYMAIGGSSVSASVGTFIAHVADDQTTQTYSLGFTPKAMIFVVGPQGNTDGTPDPGGSMSLGFATGPGASQQMCCSYWESPEASRIIKNVEYQGAAILKIGYNGDYLDTVGVVNGFGANNFSITYKSKGNLTDHNVAYIALGGTAAYALGVITEPGSTGGQTISTTGTKPVAQLFMSSGNNSSGTTTGSSVTYGFATLNSNANMTIGGADSHGQGSYSHYSPDGVTDSTQIEGYISITSALGSCSTVSNYKSEAAFQSNLSQSFKINWTTVSGTSIRYPYLVIGDAPLKSSRAMINIF